MFSEYHMIQLSCTLLWQTQKNILHKQKRVLKLWYWMVSTYKMLLRKATQEWFLLWNSHVRNVYKNQTMDVIMTTFLQSRHIPTQGYNITQSSAPDDGHMVARNMLSNY